MTDLLPDALAARYREGASLPQLAALYGMSPATIRRHLVAAGVPIRSRGKPPAVNPALDAAIAAYEDVQPLRAVARGANIPRSTLRDTLIRRGQFRPPYRRKQSPALISPN